MNGKKLLVIDSSFTLEAIRNRGLEHSVTCRDLGGYFEHVWSVHPFASLLSSRDWGPEFGRPESYDLAPGHTFIEGKIGLTPFLKWCPTLNFLLAQIDMLFFLIKLIRREKIRVMRVGDPLFLGLMGWLISRLTGVPFLIRVAANNEKIRQTTGRATMPRLFKRKAWERFVERFVLSRADLIGAVTPDNLQFAVNSGADPDKSTLFRYGNLIDGAHFVSPSRRPHAADAQSGTPFLLCIARLQAVKKVDDVIRVLAAVRNAGYDVRALLVGDGSEKSNLQKLADELGVLSHVTFCGNREQGWLARTIPQASVVVSPISGRALTEAALAGAPVAAYDIDWQGDLIKTGVTGELVSFGDWKALANCTIKLLSDRIYARAVGDRLRETVLEMMDPEKLDQHERHQYDLILKKVDG